MLLNLIWSLSALFGVGLCALSVGFDGLSTVPVFLLGFALGFVLCLLGCFLAVWIPSRRVDPLQEQDGDDPYIRGIVKLYAPAVFKLLGCKIEASGTEKLPKEGRFLLV